MKKSICYSPFNEGNFDRFKSSKFKKIKEAGFDCVDYEIANTKSFLYTASFEEVKEYAKKEKELASKSGIKINQMHGPWRFPPRDFEESDRNERMEKMKRSIRLASLLECKYWIVHPIMPFGIEDKGTGNESKTRELNLAFMKELLATAKECGVIICLENMPFKDFSLSTPDEILGFVREIDDENFKICLDTGHVVCINEETPADAVRKLGDEICALHVHDTKAFHDYHLMPYCGEIDWKDFGKALNEIGFDGAFSWEINLGSKYSDKTFMSAAKLLSDIADEIIACK